MTDPLVTLFGGKTKARILSALFSHPQESYHLRGLASAAGTDSGNTSKMLKLLVDSGLVLATPDRQSTRYSANPRSPLLEPLHHLVGLAGALMVDLRAVAEVVDAAYVGVYGSVAAGVDAPDSDVDILVVGHLSGVTAQAAFKATARKHRKTINVVAVTASVLLQNLKQGGALWASIAEGKKIDLRGRWKDVARGEASAD